MLLLVHALEGFGMKRDEIEFSGFMMQNNLQALHSLVDESTITLDKIRTERRSEFAFEGDFRYWDLRRWRIAEDVLNKRIKGLQVILHHETGKFYFIPFDAESFQRVYQQEHYYNPITSARIDNNPDLVENPLY